MDYVRAKLTNRGGPTGLNNHHTTRFERFLHESKEVNPCEEVLLPLVFGMLASLTDLGGVHFPGFRRHAALSITRTAVDSSNPLSPFSAGVPHHDDALAVTEFDRLPAHRRQSRPHDGSARRPHLEGVVR